MRDRIDCLDDLWSPALARHLDQVCVRFEAALKTAGVKGSWPRIEDYLGETAEPERSILMRELLALEQAYRGNAVGGSGSPEDQTEPEHGMRIRLTVTEGPNEGRVFTFVGHDTFLVGRSTRAHFQLPGKDSFFSRIHFLVEVNPPHCRLMDMGSRNGTAVNGKRVSSVDLHNGDEIRGGRTVLRVSVDNGSASPIVPPRAAAAPSRRPSPAPRSADNRLSGQNASRSCCACGADLADPQKAAAHSAVGSGAILCPACVHLIRSQEQSVKGYRIIRELGRGAMGVVYLALQEPEGTCVALKTITPAVPPMPYQVERFLREASILRELEHPHIVSFREMGESDGPLYFAMDYVRGTDAKRLLKENGPLPVGRAVGLICQLLDALEYAHAKKFVHRDIKPANLLVTAENRREVVKLADFGLARVYQTSQLSGLTFTGEIGGSVAFLPPEQITNFRDASPLADQYSTGATLYTLLTGHYIFDFPATHHERLLMILQDKPFPIRARRPDMPKELADIIHRTLAKEPGDRFPDVWTLRKMLRRFSTAIPNAAAKHR